MPVLTACDTRSCKSAASSAELCLVHMHSACDLQRLLDTLVSKPEASCCTGLVCMLATQMSLDRSTILACSGLTDLQAAAFRPLACLQHWTGSRADHACLTLNDEGGSVCFWVWLTLVFSDEDGFCLVGLAITMFSSCHSKMLFKGRDSSRLKVAPWDCGACLCTVSTSFLNAHSCTACWYIHNGLSRNQWGVCMLVKYIHHACRLMQG